MRTTKTDTLELIETRYLIRPIKHPGLSIIVWRENGYYGHESDYIKKDDYYYKEGQENWKIHEGLFKKPDYCYVIAHFVYDDNIGYYNFEFVDDRPLELNDEQWLHFKSLIKEGFDQLNLVLEHEQMDSMQNEI